MKADVLCGMSVETGRYNTANCLLKGNNDDLEWTDPSNMIVSVALDVSECAWIYDYGNADDNCFSICFPRNT